MDNLALVYAGHAQGLTPAPADNNGFRYIHTYEDEPDGIVSYTAWVKEKNAERDWSDKFFSGRAFIDVKTGADQKAALEERLRSLVHRDNQFYTIEDIEKFLDFAIYELSEAPRMLRLPLQSAASLSQANAADPDVLRYLSDSVMYKFLGNAYSMDWENMTGVGERVSVQILFAKFPEACRALFGDLPDAGDVRQLSIKRLDEGRIHARFYSMMTEKDIPALLEILDGDVAQTYAQRGIEGEWEHFAGAYDGISFTDRVDNLDGTPKMTWAEAEVHRDWAIPRAQRIGTVRDLVRQGVVRWPGLLPGSQDSSILRHPLKALQRAFREETRDEKNRKVFDTRLDILKQGLFGELPPSIAPRRLLTG